MHGASRARHWNKLVGHQLSSRIAKCAPSVRAYSSSTLEFSQKNQHSRGEDFSFARICRAAAAVGSVGIVGTLGWAKPSVHFEERAASYQPPAEFGKSFSSLTKAMPCDTAGQLAWAVKHLEVEKAKEILDKDPHLATLNDSSGNTLFHVAAAEPSRYGAQPKAAEEMMRLLLQSGWEVVDQKNQDGHRAEVTARQLAPQGTMTHLLKNRSHNFHEPFRMEQPLALVGEMSPVPHIWEYPVQDEQRRSFAGLVRGAVSPEKCKEWMDVTVREGAWVRTENTPRKVAWYVSEDCADCPYRYSGLEYPATVYPPFMRDILLEICGICGIPPEDYPNSCNVNLYDDHTQEVAWHSDDEVMFQGLGGDTRILSFSLGVSRDFCWRLQGTTTTLGSVPLGDGDLMTMEGLFQKHYKHSVPKSSQPVSKRINFTFRWIKVKAHAADATVKGTA